jgi:hypothetical protein
MIRITIPSRKSQAQCCACVRTVTVHPGALDFHPFPDREITAVSAELYCAVLYLLFNTSVGQTGAQQVPSEKLGHVENATCRENRFALQYSTTGTVQSHRYCFNLLGPRHRPTQLASCCVIHFRFVGIIQSVQGDKRSSVRRIGTAFTQLMMVTLVIMMGAEPTLVDYYCRSPCLTPTLPLFPLKLLCSEATEIHPK